MRWFGGVLVLAIALVSGCGSSGSSGTGVPATTKVSDLTPAQAKAMCDFINGAQGGYNKTVQCSNGPQMTDADQATCATALPMLGQFCPTLTAGDLEGCAKGPMGNICTFDTAPECAAANACISA